MPKRLAKICFSEGKGGASEMYERLSIERPDRHLRLLSFLKRLQESFEPPRPDASVRRLEGTVKYAYEWEPECVVVWQVALRPEEPMPSITRIDAYRVEVLLILTDI